jgi:hypothetical protein
MVLLLTSVFDFFTVSCSILATVLFILIFYAIGRLRVPFWVSVALGFSILEKYLSKMT